MEQVSAYRVGHYLLGVEGLALLRTANAEAAAWQSRFDEIRFIVERFDEEPFACRRGASPVDVVAGYGAWAETYDDPGNVTVELEQEIVWPLLGELPAASTVLDAACGTGRHAAFLSGLGHRVIGVDSSAEMLNRAQAKVPAADFRLADLTDLPLENASVDSAVCALALSHEADLLSGVAELARVLRRGGRLIVSNPHPQATALLNWRATVMDPSGGLSVIPEYAHSHSTSITAFLDAGLQVRGCFEATLSPELAANEAKAGLNDAFRAALTGFPVVVVWLLEKP